jgi:hypothetical protein
MATVDRREALLLFLLTGLCWWALDQWWSLPLRLLVVLFHEGAHALAAWATGGEVVDLSVGLDESGRTITRGGNELFVLNAGYLGSLGAGLALLFAGKFARGRWPGRALLLRTLGVVTVLYALRDVPSDAGEGDAALLAARTGVPALLWTLGWAATGIAVVWSLRRRLV